MSVAAEISPAAGQRISVVGAGVIGMGVAHLFAQWGHEVTLVDRDQNQLEKARKQISRNSKLYSLLQESGGKAGLMERLRFESNVDHLVGSDFVIENITEDWHLKRTVHEAIQSLVESDTPIAANTSAIPITRFGSLYKNPQRVLGMHFMNPVPLMPTVEMIRGAHTSETTLDRAKALLQQTGRDWVVVNDSAGFVTNRVMMLMVNEAMFLVHEGVSPAADVDRLFKTCFGHKMGPLETADLIGLDTVLRSIEVIYAELNDSKYRPCPLLRHMVYAGHNGRKSGRGFYVYET